MPVIGRLPCILTIAIGAFGNTAAHARAETTAAQAQDEAWWTGPLLAPNSAALPEGKFLVESYAYDSTVTTRYDASGFRMRVPTSEYLGSLTEIFYGLTDKLTIGLFGRFAYQRLTPGPHNSTLAAGDCSLQAQYQLHEWSQGGTIPTISLVLAETLPTARYDQLGVRSSDGIGTGAHVTSVAIYSQRVFRMPSNRLLRARLNVSYSFSDMVPTRGVSVYGTGEGFRGQVRPGASQEIDGAAEYSVSRHWVVAVDVDYVRSSGTLIRGSYSRDSTNNNIPASIETRLAANRLLSIAPAVEYNFTSDLGIIVGAVLPLSGRNTSASIIPMVAINMFF